MGHPFCKRIEQVISPTLAVRGIASPIMPDVARRRFGRLAVGLVLVAALTAWLPVRRVGAGALASSAPLKEDGRGTSQAAARARPFAGRAGRHARQAGGMNGMTWDESTFGEPTRLRRVGGRRMRSPRPVAHSGLSVATPDDLRRGLDRSH